MSAGSVREPSGRRRSPRTAGDRPDGAALSAGALLLAATTSPLGLLLVPLAAARLALPRRRDRVPALAFVIGTAMQIVPLLGSASTRPRQPFDVMPGIVAWQQSLTVAEQECRAGAAEGFVRTNPSRWGFHLPCEHLTRVG